MEQVTTTNGPIYFNAPIRVEKIECVQTEPSHTVKIMQNYFPMFHCEESYSVDYAKGGRIHEALQPLWHGHLEIVGLVDGQDRLTVTFHPATAPMTGPMLDETDIERLHQEAARETSLRKARALSDSGNQIVRLQPSLDPYEGESIPS